MAVAAAAGPVAVAVVGGSPAQVATCLVVQGEVPLLLERPPLVVGARQAR